MQRNNTRVVDGVGRTWLKQNMTRDGSTWALTWLWEGEWVTRIWSWVEGSGNTVPFILRSLYTSTTPDSSGSEEKAWDQDWIIESTCSLIAWGHSKFTSSVTKSLWHTNMWNDFLKTRISFKYSSFSLLYPFLQFLTAVSNIVRVYRAVLLFFPIDCCNLKRKQTYKSTNHYVSCFTFFWWLWQHAVDLPL